MSSRLPGSSPRTPRTRARSSATGPGASGGDRSASWSEGSLIWMPMRVPFDELYETLRRALLTTGMEPDRAALSARLFAEASRDGVSSHGLNRFPRFMRAIARGIVDVHARPARLAVHGAIERWDGRAGPGNLNAHESMTRAIALGREHGLGCIALSNTNHWMRGGSYGWQ